MTANSVKSFATVRLFLGVSLSVAAGCISAPNAPDVASTHPANASAALSPVPALRTGLLSPTNIVQLKRGLEIAPAATEAHHDHESKPNPEEKK